MKTIRGSLTILTMLMATYAISGFYLPVKRSECLRDIVLVRFDVPKDVVVKVNGKSVTNPVGLSHKHEYTISFYREDVLIKEIRYTPSERDRNVLRCE